MAAICSFFAVASGRRSVATCVASSRVGTRTSAEGLAPGRRALDERQAEREGLARSRRGLGEDVEAGERVRQDQLLNGEGAMDLALAERAHERRADAQRLERL